RGLQREADMEPAVRSLDLRAVEGGERRQRQPYEEEADHADALHPARREQRRADQHRETEHDHGHLLLHEMQAVELDARGGGAPSGEGQHRARDHEQHQDAERQLVDRPPPAADDARVGAGQSRAHAPPPSLRTWARKSSPRALKLRYWSNEAQAGDSSTTLA